MLPLDASQLDVVWTVLGRAPAALVLAVLTWRAARELGWRDALLGLSGFTAGALVGTALVPSILGALFGGALGALATWKALAVRVPDLSLAAPLLLALVAVGRWGCVLSGCCFGHVTTAPWGVTYGPVSLAHVLHEQLGLAAPGAPALPVVPVPALESLGLLLVLATALPLRRWLRPSAVSLVLVAEALVLRAVLDPLRAMVNTTTSRWPLGPLSVFQWLALLSAAGCVVLAVRVSRRQRALSAPRPAQPTDARTVLVWAVQLAAALLAEPHGTWLLRVLGAAAAAASAGVVLVTWAPAQRLRPAFAVGALVALVPFLTRAGQGDLTRPVRGPWLYVVDAQAAALVPASEPPLTTLEDAQPEDAGVRFDELEASRGVSDAGVASIERAFERSSRTLAFTALGGQQAYYFSSCSGGSGVVQRYGDLSAQYEQEGPTQNLTMLRGRLLAGGTARGEAVGSALVTGFYEFRWERVSVGLGGSVSGSVGPYSEVVVPQAVPLTVTPQVTLGFGPLLYLRVEPFRGAALELGTGSRFQPQDGAFVGFRFGTDRLDGFAVRLGLESTWIPHPLVNTNGFVDFGFPVGASRLHVRLVGHADSTSAALSGGLRWAFHF